ncbi:MAG: aminotransferase class I/II-fold pyridoxal phosphate-dependent enzyme [Betaproteobacteria bacterium]|nr:aminotransferase class I/II-fold pyridoxal phosphate-dependent enzyme [Betaproteobacteria bacterium]
MSSALFADVSLAPRDPILGLTEAFLADTRPNKVNLGVGVYLNNEGKVPLLDAVRQAERERLELAPPRGYLPIEGFADYNIAVLNLLFANNKDLIEQGRCASFEALGGTGGLKIGADFIKRMKPEATVWISDPSWENHRALFEAAGFPVKAYRYYDAPSHGVRFDALIADIHAMKAGDVIVLHACCHNPTGVDLTAPQWREVIAAVGSTPALREIWERELGQMRERIREMRRGFVDGLKALGVQRDFSFVIQQRGMFSYSGLSSDQVDRLREEFGIYAVSSGRICLAALNTRNLGSVCEAVAKVL